MVPSVYKDYEIIKETFTEGFYYGEITDHFFTENENDAGCLSGDGFVQAPDGSRAGIIWEVVEVPYLSICIEPEEDRWGVYNVGFVRPIKTLEDLIFNFRNLLPLLKKAYIEAKDI
ncbi:3-deoxy-8-phosphooctulonate synthase [Lysinibacillus xylanilyticus]|uniref:3-deoxy-8-phosphooctulonate synthase n=1 Tax=Lysinibacillus xylanilyticus TaxID=582475 RepID=UPI003823FF5B